MILKNRQFFRMCLGKETLKQPYFMKDAETNNKSSRFIEENENAPIKQ